MPRRRHSKSLARTWEDVRLVQAWYSGISLDHFRPYHTTKTKARLIINSLGFGTSQNSTRLTTRVLLGFLMDSGIVSKLWRCRCMLLVRNVRIATSTLFFFSIRLIIPLFSDLVTLVLWLPHFLSFICFRSLPVTWTSQMNKHNLSFLTSQVDSSGGAVHSKEVVSLHIVSVVPHSAIKATGLLLQQEARSRSSTGSHRHRLFCTLASLFNLSSSQCGSILSL